MKKLLLHVCCAPCSAAVLDEVRHKYDLTVFFYNPNIYPDQEYLKRKAEVIRLCREWAVPFVDRDGTYGGWEAEIGSIPQEKEGGSRCSACFRERLTVTAQHAKEHGFDQFGTCLSSGRMKKSPVINAIGQAIGQETEISFLDEDWKKKGRYEKGLALVKEKGIYRQKYCGCKQSKIDAGL